MGTGWRHLAVAGARTGTGRARGVVSAEGSAAQPSSLSLWPRTSPVGYTVFSECSAADSKRHALLRVT